MKFYLSDVPKSHTIIQYIKENSDFLSVCSKFKGMHEHLHKKFHVLQVDRSAANGLKNGVIDAIEQYGLHAWLSSSGRPSKSEYDSLSLTWNSKHKDCVDQHVSTLGTAEVASNAYYYGKDLSERELRNGYYDTYAFTDRTDATLVEGLKEFYDSFDRTITRSRISAIRPEYSVTSSFNFGWHRDESIFENTRVIVPIETENVYRIQFETVRDTPSENSNSMLDIHVPHGCALVFDTNQPHRAYRSGQSDSMRTHAVFGISPWFDYKDDEKAWEANEYYGLVHPIDMVCQGLFTRFIKHA